MWLRDRATGWVLAAAATWALGGIAGCTTRPVDFTGRRCPCDEGWTCDQDRDLCIEGDLLPGLIVWYRLDGDPGQGPLIDATGRGWPASCSGRGCPSPTDGTDGRALAFDGSDDHLTVAPNDALRLDDAFSVAVDIAPARLLRSVVLAQREEGADTPRWALEIDAAGRLSLVLAIDGGHGRVTSPPESLSVGTWHRVLATWDGTTADLWIDGEPAGSAEVAHGGARGGLLLGGDGAHGLLLPYDGGLADVQVYGRALDGGDAASLARR